MARGAVAARGAIRSYFSRITDTGRVPRAPPSSHGGASSAAAATEDFLQKGCSVKSFELQQQRGIRFCRFSSAGQFAVQRRAYIADRAPRVSWTTRKSIMAGKEHEQFPRSRFSRAYSSDLPAHQEIGMPSLSPTMTQGNIAKWKKKEGDRVAAGDVLCEIETDKATLEMESMEEGYLAKILVGDGTKDIEVGTTICVMVEDQGDIQKFADFKGAGSGGPPPQQKASSPPPPPSSPKESAAAPPKPSSPPAPAPSSGSRVFATPAAKKLASEKHVELSSIRGTGPEGHIVKADVEDYLLSGASTAAKQQRADGALPKAQQMDVSLGQGLDYSDIPNNQIKRITASRLLQSKQTIPHYYLSLDLQVDKLLALRQELNRSLESSKRKKLTMNDFVIKASALSLKKVPECNSSWTDDFIRQFHNVNISVAVQTDRGLMVPVVQHADRKGLSAISEDVETLAERARTSKSKPTDFEGGTFTVSNLGSPAFGIKQFCAIINPPQSCILAVGTTEKRVVPLDNGEFGRGTFMTVTLSCDHRVVDGAIGAKWLASFRGYIEEPTTLLL